MENNMEIIKKYELDSLKKLDQNNMNRIISFLKTQNCDYIDDLLSDYLDLFLFDVSEFIDKYQQLNVKYNNHFLELASENMNLFEEFYYI